MLLKLENNKVHEQTTILEAVQVDEMLHHWRGETFPILADLITSRKASKFMCDPVVVPFQVSNLPAAETMKQPARFKIPWARWPISSLFSFATIL